MVRLPRHSLFSVVPLLVLLLVGVPLQAQEEADAIPAEKEAEAPEPTEEEKAAGMLGTIQAELDSVTVLMGRTVDPKDEEFQLLRVQAERHIAVIEDIEPDLIEILARLDSTSTEKSRIEAGFHQHLKNKYDIYDQTSAWWIKEIKVLRNLRADAPDEGLGELESRIGSARSRIDQLLLKMERIIETGEAQGLEVSQVYQRFDGLLRGRADDLLARLKVAIESRDDIEDRIQARERAKESESLITPLRVKLQLAERRVTGVASSLSATADLLDRRGFDASVYRQDIIKSTGEISDKMLDLKVLRGLAADLGEGLRNWFATNGPTILVKILIILATVFMTRLMFRLVWWLLRLVHLIKLTRLMIQLGNSLVAPIASIVGLFMGLWVIGADPTTLLTGAGVAGVIIGFALQDSLANLAAGFFILATRPFDIDDVIRTGNVVGTVKAMWIANTTVVTFDGRRLLIPNRKIWADIIENRSVEPNRRVDVTVRVGFDEDIDRAIAILKDLVANEERVLKHPEPSIFVGKWADSWVDIEVRPWARNEHWWAMYTDLPRLVALRFREEGIEIPSPRVAMTGLPDDQEAPKEGS